MPGRPVPAQVAEPLLEKRLRRWLEDIFILNVLDQSTI
jgi:hypothetical protein